MTQIMDVLAELQRHGVELIAALHKAGDHANVVRDVAAGFGLPTQRVKELRMAGQSMFGPLREASDQKARAKSVARAKELGLSAEALIIVTRHVRALRPNAPIKSEDLRAQLTEAAATMTVDELKAHAAEIVRRANETTPNHKEEARSVRFARASASADAEGTKTLFLRGPEDEINAVLATCDEDVRRTWNKADGRRHDQVRYDILIRKMAGNDPSTETARVSAYQTVAVVPSDVAFRGEVTDAAGHDIIVATTNGATMTGREFLQKNLGDDLTIMLYDCEDQPINLYRARRSASAKQRLMVSVDQLVCSHDGCARPAEHCEIHHIEAWKNGGETNLANLSLACTPDNAANDDDRRGHPNGYFVRGPDGRVGRRTPDGRTHYNVHPLTRYSGRAHIKRERQLGLVLH